MGRTAGMWLRWRPLVVITASILIVALVLSGIIVVLRRGAAADAARPLPGWGAGPRATPTATTPGATPGTTTNAAPPPASPSQPAKPAVETPGPSGLAMPRGDLPGWRQVLADDFAGTDLDRGWGAYNGPISSTPGGVWNPSHVRVGDGLLRLLGYREGDKFVTGGLMNHGPAQTRYGKYEVRFRADKGNGVKYAILLWPSTDKWPDDGEIDFAEDGGGDRAGFTATLHYAVDGQDNQTQREAKVDLSGWHTVGVEWTEGKIVYTLDGRAWSTITTSHPPVVPMNLVIQTEAAVTCTEWVTCLDQTTPAHVNLEVDWVVAYARP